MFLTSGQKYGSLANYPEEEKIDDEDCLVADNLPQPTSIYKKKLGLSFICCGVLFIVFNRLEQFAGVRHTIGVFSGRRNTIGFTHEKVREMNVKDAPVFGIMKMNLALSGLASQSSIGYSGAATRGNDGNTDGNWSGGSVTHTSGERQPWWKVDLGGSFPIRTVKLYNRIDCCAARLSGFQVQLLDSEGSVVASKDYNRRMIITNSMTMIFDDIKASQVKVLMKDTGVDRVLSLAEVEVFS